MTRIKITTEMKALFNRKDFTTHGREFFKNKDRSQVDLSKLDLNKEEDRRVSFMRNNWQNNFISHERLALFGFYFYKKPDYVRCKFCKVTLSNFEPNDDPLDEHLKFSRNCPLILRRENANIPIDKDELNAVLPRVSYDECPSDDEKEDVSENSSIKFPEFLLENTRLQTFSEWPKGLNQKPSDLAAAGFFYNGSGDRGE
jgi:baculoviral IAP repeat-containing protein 7/8